MGTLLYLVIVLILAGLVLWVVGQLPIDAAILKLIRVVVIVVAVLYVLGWVAGWIGSPPFPVLSAPARRR